MIFWLIGLSGAGKTTIGLSLAKKLKKKYPNTAFLDGDIIRKIVGDNLGYDKESRMKSGWRICRLCEHLDKQGIHVVCGVISLFREHQTWNREHYSKYFEVFIDVPVEDLIERDSKGIYKQYLEGTMEHVAGLDLPFEPPSHSDLIVKNSIPFQAPSQIADLILAKAEPLISGFKVEA